MCGAASKKIKKNNLKKIKIEKILINKKTCFFEIKW